MRSATRLGLLLVLVMSALLVVGCGSSVTQLGVGPIRGGKIIDPTPSPAPRA